jgi:hypothetical protein
MAMLQRAFGLVTAENTVVAACVAVGLTLLESGATRTVRRVTEHREVVATRALVSPIRYGTVFDEFRTASPATTPATRGYLWVNLSGHDSSRNEHRALCDVLRDTVMLQRFGLRAMVSAGDSSDSACATRGGQTLVDAKNASMQFVALPALAPDAAWAVLDSAHRVIYSVHRDAERSTTRTLPEVLEQVVCGRSTSCVGPR